MGGSERDIPAAALTLATPSFVLGRRIPPLTSTARILNMLQKEHDAGCYTGLDNTSSPDKLCGEGTVLNGPGHKLRRTCLGGLAAIGLLVIAATGTAEQGARAPRIGVLSGQSTDKDLCLQRFRQGLSELAYVEGKTHVLEIRRSEGRQQPIPRLAGELVGLKVDLIVSLTSEAHLSVKQATATIPFVMAVSTYPVEQGLVASLARPGGNITGLATFTPDLMAKRVQILKEAVPTVSRLAVIRQPGHRNDLIVRDYETAAQQLGINLRVVEVRGSEDLAGAFQKAVRDRAQAVMSTQGPFFAVHAARIAELALKHRLPSLSGEVPLGPEAGILLSYGPSVSDDCQRAASYVDRILKGAKPAELPVEQPKKIESIINLKTARALDLTIPPSLLIRATRIIE
jgi:putative tryptophan/tyrosine transport system substrate-binding protein